VECGVQIPLDGGFMLHKHNKMSQHVEKLTEVFVPQSDKLLHSDVTLHYQGFCAHTGQIIPKVMKMGTIFLDIFTTKSCKNVLLNVCMNTLRTDEQIFIKFDIGEFY
jgi:hypothetical protein